MGLPRAPALPWALAFAGGASFQQLAPRPAGALAALALAGAGLACRGRGGALAIACAAGLWLALPAGGTEPDPEVGRAADVRGRVCSSWRATAWSQSAALCVDRLRQADRERRAVGELRLELPPAAATPAPGSSVRARGLLSRSAGFANEREVEPGPWRLRVKSAALLTVEAGPGRLARLAAGIRARARAGFEAPSRRGRPGLAIARALLLGDPDAMPVAWRRTLQRCGLAHLVAVSGFNLSLVAGLLLIAGAGLPRGARLALAGVGVLYYLVVVGAGPAVVRAALMSWLVLAGLGLRRAPAAGQTLALALVVVVVLDPAALLDPGCQLSFAATAGLLLLAPRWAGRLGAAGLPRALAMPLAASLAAQAAAVPWSVAAFGDVAPAAPLLNLVAVPWATVALIGGGAWALLAALAPAAWADAAALLLDPLAWPVAALARLPPSPLLSMPLPGGLATGVAAAAAFAAIGEGGRAGRAVGLGVLLLAAARPGPERGRFEAVFADVGQGDAALLTHGGKAVLIDGGGTAAYDLGGRVLRPLLADRGIGRVHVAVVTHADVDHCAGLVDLAAYLPFEEVWAPAGSGDSPCVRALGQVARGGLLLLRRGARLARAGFTFEVLHPDAAATPVAGNADSLVLAVSGGGRRLLFTGDLDAAAERDLVARDSARLDCDVLKVPHHGSAGSTSPELARAAAPALAVVSAGVRDPYGHPAAAVCARLAGSGARVLRTDRDGAVTLSWRAYGPWRVRLPGAPRRLRDDG